MEKVNLSKAELALLDALIADLQEESDESGVLSDPTASMAFIGAIGRLAMRSFKLTAKVTPIAARAVGKLGQTSGAAGSSELSDAFGADGETLSVDQLIELRKAAN